MWKIPPSHIYIFSKTATFDLAYRPYIRYAMEYAKKNSTPINIFETIDMETIRNVVEEQKKLKKMNMSTDKNGRVEIPKVLFIYDDILGDS